MDVASTRVIESLVWPPGGPLLLAATGILILRKRPHAGAALAASAALLLWLASLPAVSFALLHSLQIYPPLDAGAIRDAKAQAIIVLGAGRNIDAPEYGGRDTVSRWALERLRYGAYLHRITGLPVLVSGGSATGHRVPEARLMAGYLRHELRVEPVWQEDRSRTTAENAVDSARLLHARGIKRAFLVTHAWHEWRAVESFHRVGFDVIPAPTAFVEQVPSARNWLPDAEALEETTEALHEWGGRAFYALRWWLDASPRNVLSFSLRAAGTKKTLAVRVASERIDPSTK